MAGNPYSQHIDFNQVTRSEVFNAAYVYDTNATGITPAGPVGDHGGAWRSVSGGYGDIPGGIIAPGQGFFVQTAEGAVNPSLTFSESNQTGGGAFYGKESPLRDFVRLEGQGEDLYNSAWIRFSTEGSMDPGDGDALELLPLSENYAVLGARKADGSLMDIAHFPADESDLEIPLVVDAARSGEFTLTATDLDLPVGMTLYLHDRHTGQSMPINSTGFKYTFHLTDDASPKQISTSTHTADGSRNQIPASTHMADGSREQISASTHMADGSREQIFASMYMADGSREQISTSTHTADGSRNQIPASTLLADRCQDQFSASTLMADASPTQISAAMFTDDGSPEQISTSTHTADGSRNQIPASTHMADGSSKQISTPTHIADGSRKQISTSTYMADGSRNGLIAASPMAITDPANTAITEADRFMITTSPGAPQNEIPGQVALDQNYPNPFNPATQITYHLPGQSQVHLDVFDITGRKIATLVDEQMGAGSHTASFSAEFLSTGVYIYRLTAHGMDGTSQTLTRKLTLIK